MLQELLSPGDTQAVSSTFVVAQGSFVGVQAYSTVDGIWAIEIHKQVSSDGWIAVGLLNSSAPAGSLVAPGTYRLARSLGYNCAASIDT